MKLRTQTRKPEHAIEDLLPRFYEDGHRIDPGPPWRSENPDPVEQRQTLCLVRESIAALPEIDRRVLILRDIEELSTDETARMLEVKPETVKVRLHRARQALRTLMTPHLAGGAP